MIHKIAIKNYKSIVDLELELGKLNVFIGENGCGKTNILEAIASSSIIAETRSTHLSTGLMSLRGIRVTEAHLMKSAFNSQKEDEGSDTVISIFSEKKAEFIVNISYRNKLFETRFKTNLEKVVPVPEEYRYTGQKQEKEYRRYLNVIFERNILSSFYNYAPENYFLRRFEEEGQVKPLGIRGEGLFKHLVEIYKNKPELLTEIGDKLRLIGWFEGFEIPKDLFFTERRINIKDKYLQEIDYFDQRSANEGFLYLLFYFTLFISPYTPKFFAIDNIDNSLNPKLCSELTRQLAILAKKNDKQAILTTHNPAILDGLDLTDDDQRLFIIYRNSEGHTVAKRVEAPKKVKGVESIRLSEAFIRGYIGGLPKNF